MVSATWAAVLTRLQRTLESLGQSLLGLNAALSRSVHDCNAGKHSLGLLTRELVSREKRLEERGICWMHHRRSYSGKSWASGSCSRVRWFCCFQRSYRRLHASPDGLDMLQPHFPRTNPYHHSPFVYLLVDQHVGDDRQTAAWFKIPRAVSNIPSWRTLDTSIALASPPQACKTFEKSPRDGSASLSVLSLGYRSIILISLSARLNEKCPSMA